jgi:chromate transporter
MLIVWLFAVLYQKYQSVPELSFILYGIKPVIIAIVLQALWGLGKTALKSVPTTLAGAATALLFMVGWSEILLLLISGACIMLWSNRKRIYNQTNVSLWLPILWMHHSAPISSTSAAVKTNPLSLTALFLTFLKIGSVLYGSGYVLLAFLQSNFVEHFGVLSSQQLLDAVAVGQFTPGPVFTTATFVGYLIHGNSGALLATIAIFLPAFVFVALISPWSTKLRKSVWISGLLDGVNAASLGLMAVVGLQLGKAALIDIWTFILAILAFFLLIRFKINSVWIVLAGAFIGWIIRAHS